MLFKIQDTKIHLLLGLRYQPVINVYAEDLPWYKKKDTFHPHAHKILSIRTKKFETLHLSLFSTSFVFFFSLVWEHRTAALRDSRQLVTLYLRSTRFNKQFWRLREKSFRWNYMLGWENYLRANPFNMDPVGSLRWWREEHKERLKS